MERELLELIIRHYTLYKESIMSKTISLTASPRNHTGKMDNEITLSGLENKIRELDNTESLNVSITGNQQLKVNYQIPVYIVRHHCAKYNTNSIYLRPWTAQAAGATTLTNLQLNTRSKWNRYMTTQDIDPNKRFVLPSLEHLFPTDERVSYKETNRAEDIRNRDLNPLEHLDE